MEESTRLQRAVRFGAFEVDLRAGEVRKRGLKIKLQEKPFQILAMLLERPGEIVTREELRKKLWPADTFVDFDHSLNTGINKIREALRDSADNPRFVETLARRGYRFVAPVDELGQASRPRPKPPAEKIRLAVLPFHNLSADPEQEYFSEGMTEEMIAHLGRLHPQRLGVIAGNSAMRYKHTDRGIDQIGHELGVDYILAGSVRRAADRVRITAQLIQVSDQTHLWAEIYERQLADVLAIQSDVAGRIARSLTVELLPAQQAALARASTTNSEAYEAYLKGRYHWNKRTEEGLKKAIEYFEQATAKDPEYALAYAGLAECLSVLGWYSLHPPKESVPIAKAAATKALEIDNKLAEAHTSLASAKMYYDWDWLGAEREFKLALELNPNYATAHHWYGDYLVMMGRFAEASTELERAHELDPLSLIINKTTGDPFYYGRQYDQAIEHFRKIIEAEPNFYVTHIFLGWAYEQKGQFPEAIAEFETASRLDDSPVILAALGRAYAVSGKRGEAQKVLEELKELSQRRYVSPYLMAIIYTGLRKKDQAFEWLEEAYQDRSDWLAWLKVDPRLDSLRSDPRFTDLLGRVGLAS